MKNHILPRTLLLAILAVVATGCVTHRVKENPPGDAVYPATSKPAVMKVALAVRPRDAESRRLADGVRTAATTALRDRSFQVVEDGSADVDLSLSAAQTVFNNAADKFFTLDGEVDAQLLDVVTGNILARTTLRDRAGPELGKDAAAVALSGKVDPKLRDWIAATVTPEQIGLSASQIRVTQIDLHMGAEAGFIRDFVDHVSKMKGVLRCETLSVDKVDHVAVFRILWRNADFPTGLLPAIATSFPGHKFVL